MDKIHLNFINRSQDTNNSSVVIFQQNAAESLGELPIAWKVIENCGISDNHPFTYPLSFMVSAGDDYGNYTPQLQAGEGRAFEMVKTGFGNTLQPSENTASSATEVEVRNSLDQGSISANCFRDGKLLATKANLAPGQKAVFEFHPKIRIGVVSQMDEGGVINAAIVSEGNSEIDLSGIKSADIVMTGGGPGKLSTPFNFTLENIVQ